MNQQDLIIPSSKEIFRRIDYAPIRLFGIGNEKRDLQLLLRGDIRIPRPVDMGFFGCPDCGSIGFQMPHIESFNGDAACRCHRCGSRRITWFEGIWRGTKALVNKSGEFDGNYFRLGYTVKSLVQWQK